MRLHLLCTKNFFLYFYLSSAEILTNILWPNGHEKRERPEIQVTPARSSICCPYCFKLEMEKELKMK